MDNKEIIKLAAARVMQREMSKESQGLMTGLGTLAALGGMGYAFTKLLPEEWEWIKDWFNTNILGRTGSDTPVTEEPTSNAPATTRSSVRKIINKFPKGESLIENLRQEKMRRLVPENQWFPSPLRFFDNREQTGLTRFLNPTNLWRIP